VTCTRRLRSANRILVENREDIIKIDFRGRSCEFGCSGWLELLRGYEQWALCFSRVEPAWSTTRGSVMKHGKVRVFRPSYQYKGDSLWITIWKASAGVSQYSYKLLLWLTKHHAMKRYWESGGIAPRILSLGTRWRWVVSFTPRPLWATGTQNCTVFTSKSREYGDQRCLRFQFLKRIQIYCEERQADCIFHHCVLIILYM
jgi:hypothetical protein